MMPVAEMYELMLGASRAASAGDLDRKQVSVIQLVAEYRFRGCLLADLDPDVRQNAAYALGEMHARAAIPLGNPLQWGASGVAHL